jgi:hypothetical protein
MCELWRDEFQGNGATEVLLQCSVDDAHSAMPDQRFESVTTEDGAGLWSGLLSGRLCPPVRHGLPWTKVARPTACRAGELGTKRANPDGQPAP